jgi:hypothetical protein
MEAMRGGRKRWTLGPAVAEEASTTIPQEGTGSNRPAILRALVPILAGLLGLFNGFRMVRVPEPAATRPVEGVFG